MVTSPHPDARPDDVFMPFHLIQNRLKITFNKHGQLIVQNSKNGLAHR